MEVMGQEQAFPRLSSEELETIRRIASRQPYGDGETVFRAGQRNIDFYAVESGQLEVLNPTAGNARVTMHQPGEFAGDIDLLTGRPVVVSAVARGETVLLRASSSELRHILLYTPRLGEKLITAFHLRRELLQKSGAAGVLVVGEPHSPENTLIREFLHRNLVPFTWHDSNSEVGREQLCRLMGKNCATPIVQTSDGEILCRPTLLQLARKVGLQQCCSEEVFDLAVVGAGPAGMTAAVYAASEGLSTIVIDTLGPGGQAGGSSLIENFIGFPSGLSGTELATRGVLQMLKFGAKLMTPVRAQQLIEGPQWHTLRTDVGQEIRSRVILVATGAKWRQLDVPGAQRYHRAGIFYAATGVEARICTGQDVAVVGCGNSAAQAAVFLSECAPAVHLLIREEALGKGMSQYLVQRIGQNPRIHLRPMVEVIAISGDGRLSGVVVQDRTTGRQWCIPCAAVFAFIGAEPHTEWMPENIARNPEGYLYTGAEAKQCGQWNLQRDPLLLETSLPRVLAAGDIRAGSTKRVAAAVGDGAMAISCIHRLRDIS